MLAFLKRRVVLVTIGLGLLVLCVWWLDPLYRLSDGTWTFLGPDTTRFVAVGLVLAWYGIWVLVKRVRAKSAGDKLAAAVVSQSPGERPSADVIALRERFEEAVTALKKKRDGHSLYELPWYVIIGAPGSGKTTALENSGLHFPVEQRAGRRAMRGVGGTRNCDWLFTDEAVFLDTAGRYTTQDSDASADSAGWTEFLGLLKKYRKRRPINGVILAISAHDLMVQGQAGREAHVTAARRRLNELNKELRIQLPVYVLVTKCDLVSGFMEYFADVAQDARTQVWGVTFPQELTRTGRAAAAFPAEFDALMSRLNERVFGRLEDDRDVRRRAKVFGFPQQMGALRETLTEYVTELFESTRFDQQVLLRGVYFTSGTQEGTPIDRLLGAIGRRFSVPAEAVMPGARGKAYFIERLLKDVLLAESGLAGVNRRHEAQKAALELGTYIGMALLAVLGVVLLSVAYNRNVAYIEHVGSEVQRLQNTTAASARVSLDGAVSRLNDVRDVVRAADSRPEHVHWSVRWIYPGSRLESEAREAYAREVDAALLDRLAAFFRQGMGTATSLVHQYRYLKGYLMLRLQDHLDTKYLGNLAALEWTSAYRDNDLGNQLAGHFTTFLEYRPNGFPPPSVEAGDDDLVERTRDRLLAVSIPDLIYGEVQTEHAGPEGAVSLEARVLRPSRGGPPMRSVPALYTRETFWKVVPDQIEDIQLQFKRDYQWVFGGKRTQQPIPADVRQKVTAAYEKDYIAEWNKVLDSIGMAPGMSLDQTKEALRAISGKASVLRKLLEMVDHHTFLVKSMDPPKPDGVWDSMLSRFNGMLGVLQKALTPHAQDAGAQVTAYFLPIHALLAGEPGKAPIDELLAEIEKIREVLDKLGEGVGEKKPTETDLRDLDQMSDSLKRNSAELSGSAQAVGNLVSEVGAAAASAARGFAGGNLAEDYARNVLEACSRIVTGQYPFVDGSANDVTTADFGGLLGYDGVFDQFFKAHLENLVDTNARPWRWRTGAPAGVPLPVFQRADQIRETFFPLQARMPQVRFDVTILNTDDGANRFELSGLGGTAPLVWAHTAPRAQPVEWPDPKPGPVAATWVDKAGRRPSIVTEGPWAWFRLLQRGTFKEETSQRYMLRLEKEGHWVEIRVNASSINNPFGAMHLLKGFPCR